MPLDEEKKYLIDLSKKNLMNFRKEKINRNNLIYKYKTVRRSPKYFSDYQNLIDLFINSRDGNVNSREVLKNTIDFKSDLGKIKKGNPKSKSEDQKWLIQNVQKCFDLREKKIFCLEIILFWYLKLSTKQNMEKEWKY